MNTTHAVAPCASLAAEYFDGHSAQAHPVHLHVQSDQLLITGEGIRQAVPLAQLRWPERTRHGVRLLHLPDGASLHCRDSVAWDTWAAHAASRRDSLVVHAQLHWRWALASLLAVMMILVAGYRWGLPAASVVIVAELPEAADETIGDAALAQIDQQRLVGPSTLNEAQRDAIRAAFTAAVAHLPVGTAPRFRLEFRHGGRVGPNAFALPGGTIVLTDELVERVHANRDMLIGVLGHELGHLRHRDGMRMLVQSGVIAATASALYGDFSTLLALLPTWLAQASYSRDAERQADRESVRLLRANGISPAVMAEFFTVLRQPAKGHAGASGGPHILALASHPVDAERVAFFKRCAAQDR